MTRSSVVKPSLLIVDDDPLIADTLGFYLENDFQVVTASSRREAMRWVRSQPSPPDLALVDLGLPPCPASP